jgi:hypothetical protein
MRKFGLKPQPFSGAGELFKEDGENENILAQLKSTQGKSISLKKSDILMLIKHAHESHKTPVFFLNFTSEDDNDITMICVRPFDLEEVIKNINLKE